MSQKDTLVCAHAISVGSAKIEVVLDRAAAGENQARVVEIARFRLNSCDLGSENQARVVEIARIRPTAGDLGSEAMSMESQKSQNLANSETRNVSWSSPEFVRLLAISTCSDDQSGEL